MQKSLQNDTVSTIKVMHGNQSPGSQTESGNDYYRRRNRLRRSGVIHDFCFAWYMTFAILPSILVDRTNGQTMNFESGPNSGLASSSINGQTYAVHYRNINSQPRYFYVTETGKYAGYDANRQLATSSSTLVGLLALVVTLLNLLGVSTVPAYTAARPFCRASIPFGTDSFLVMSNGSLNAGIITYKYTTNSGDGITESSYTSSDAIYTYGGEADSNSGIVYLPLATSTSTGTLGKFNSNTNSFTKSAVNTPSMPRSLILFDDSVIVAGQFDTLRVYAKSNFALTLTQSITSSTFQLIRDNLTPNKLVLSYLNSPYGVGLVDYYSGIMATTNSIPLSSQALSITNLGTHNYILVAVSMSNLAIVLSKQTLVSSSSSISFCVPGLASSCTPNPATLATGFTMNERVDFAYQATQGSLSFLSLVPSDPLCTGGYTGSTCTSCGTGMYWVNAIVQCVSQDDLPDGFGPDLSSSPLTAYPCKSQCRTCSSDYLLCDECRDGLLDRPDLQTGCTTNTYPGYGLDTTFSPSKIVPCQPLQCQDCLSDYQICSVCKAGYAWKSDEGSGGNCYSKSTEQGYGQGGASNNLIYPCLVSDCHGCSLDYTKCEECKPGYYLLAGRSDVCVSRIYEGYGIDVAAVNSPSTLYPCIDSNCEYCDADISVCTSCFSSSSMLVQRGLDACKLNNLPGYGHNLADASYLDACSTSNCAICFADRSICIECIASFAFKSDNLSGGCFSKTTTAGYGPSSSSPTQIFPCSIQFCQKCSTDHTACDECVLGYALLLGRTDNCVSSTLAIDSYGHNVSASPPLTLYPCADPYCLLCFSDVNICQKCTPASNRRVRRDLGQCVQNDNVGFGLDRSDPDYIAACSDAWCRDCYQDSRICKTFPNGKYYLNISRTEWKAEESTIIITFDGILVPKLWEDLLTISIQDANGVSISSVQVLEIKTSEGGRSISIKLVSSLSQRNLTATISHKNPSKPVFESTTHEYPSDKIVTVKEVSFAGSDNSVTFNKEALGRGRTIATETLSGVALATSGYSSSSMGASNLRFVLNILSGFDYLGMTNGRRTIRSDRFLDIMQSKPLEIFENFFKFDETVIKCIPSVNFLAEDVSCNIVNNYGSEFQTHVILFTITVLVICLSRWVYRLRYQRTLYFYLNVTSMVLSSIFNLDTIMSLVDGSQVEIIRLAGLNLVTTSSNKPQSIGTVISIIALTAYTVYGICIFVRCSRLSRRKMPVKTSPNTSGIKFKSPKMGKMDFRMVTVKAMEKQGRNNLKKAPPDGSPLKLWTGESILSYLHAEYKTVVKYTFLYYLPAMGFIKNALSQLILVIMGGTNLSQLYMLTCIEGAGLLISLVSLTAEKGWKKFGRLALAMCYCGIFFLYIELNAPVFLHEDDENIATALCVLYGCMIVVAVAFFLDDVVQGMLRLSKKLIRNVKISRLKPLSVKSPYVIRDPTQPKRKEKTSLAEFSPNDVPNSSPDKSKFKFKAPILKTEMMMMSTAQSKKIIPESLRSIGQLCTSPDGSTSALPSLAFRRSALVFRATPDSTSVIKSPTKKSKILPSNKLWNPADSQAQRPIIKTTNFKSRILSPRKPDALSSFNNI